MNRTKIIFTTIVTTIVLLVVTLLITNVVTQPALSQNNIASFDTIVNFRDLGTYQLKDGRQIATNKLLRSGSLDDLSAADMRTLTETYNLNQIIDLRLPNEVETKPDTPIPATTYHHIDVYENGTETLPSLAQLQHTEATQGTRVDIVNRLRKIYERITVHPDSHQAMRKVFDILLTNDNGAVLWHCTSGKDRTGLVTAILLHILGASKETIYQDYMQTNEARKVANDAHIEELRNQGMSEEIIADMVEILTVREQYLDYTFELIDEHYGNIDNYIEDVLHISQDDQTKLRALYLV